ncbi:MAG: zinc ribbon domain-containing protein [Anaerolineae bacterium]|jgi:putative FmdB family regulatory protein
MPIYEYRCQGCANTFELLVRGSAPVACPACGSQSLDKLLSVPFVASGRTARPAGRTCCGQEERCSEPPCSGGEACRHA